MEVPSQTTDGPSIPLPLEKLQFLGTHDETKKSAVLVETGSFNPPTNMHLRMFESGRDALIMHGYFVMGGYMSPVNDAYGKKGLILAEHRIKMCQLATEGSSFIMVDPWEALQPSYQRTIKVLARVRDALQEVSTYSGPIRAMLLCGADLLHSFTVPGIWIPDQVESICRDYGLVCLQRGGRDLRKLIQECDLLSKYNENIIIVDNFENNISSTEVRYATTKHCKVSFMSSTSLRSVYWLCMRVFIKILLQSYFSKPLVVKIRCCGRQVLAREKLAKDLPVDSLTPASVIHYIKSNNLYSMET